MECTVTGIWTEHNADESKMEYCFVTFVFNAQCCYFISQSVCSAMRFVQFTSRLYLYALKNLYIWSILSVKNVPSITPEQFQFWLSVTLLMPIVLCCCLVLLPVCTGVFSSVLITGFCFVLPSVCSDEEVHWRRRQHAGHDRGGRWSEVWDQHQLLFRRAWHHGQQW